MQSSLQPLIQPTYYNHNQYPTSISNHNINNNNNINNQQNSSLFYSKHDNIINKRSTLFSNNNIDNDINNQ